MCDHVDVPEGKDAALAQSLREEATTVALWALLERERLAPSLRTWARRRFLRRVFRDNVAEVDRLTDLLAPDQKGPTDE